MKSLLTLIIFSLYVMVARAQSCDEVIKFVKSKSYGTTYNSFSSQAISRVTFYTVNIDNRNQYFAIVCFKNSYFGCTEYIYQVASNTSMNYSQ